MSLTPDVHGAYHLSSRSEPGTTRTVAWQETQTGWQRSCDCPAGRHGRRCWHVTAAEVSDRARSERARTAKDAAFWDDPSRREDPEDARSQVGWFGHDYA